MKKLPIGIQFFDELIRENYVYVDKTRYIYDLITTGKYYFLSRPRRFGKSLLVSTLAAIFAGKKELFKNLTIDTLTYEWKQHPVIAISLADIPCTSVEELERGLKLYLHKLSQENGITVNEHVSSGELLRHVVQELSRQAHVVLLIDEYDYPIIKHIHKIEHAEQMREALRNFYAVIKGLDQYLKFVLLTGVSKFAKASIFSGLNNLEDISISSEFNALLGYTRDEIVTHFNNHLTLTASELHCSVEQLLNDITLWYDGYQFSHKPNALKIYNPFSVLLCLKKHQFSNYWFESGTPTFLINLLKSKNYPIQELDHSQASSGELGQFEIDNIELKTLMFQTGYLTIKSYNSETRNYTLGYPNKETIDSLGEYIIKSMTETAGSSTNAFVASLYKAFQNADFNKIFTVLTEFFATIPYTIQMEAEKYYQTIFYVAFTMIGAHIIVEQPTNIGRIDVVLQTNDYCFIIEFKINSTALNALEQIEEKKYYQPYQSTGKKIVLVGINFDTATRNISDIKHKKLKSCQPK